MAKKKTASASKTIVLRPIQMKSSPARRAPSVTIVRAPAPKPVKHHRRKHGGGKHSSERHRLAVIAGGYVLGMVDNSDIDIPTIPMLGRAGTIGVGAYILYKLSGNEYADAAATAALSIAAYELGKDGAVSGDEGL